MIVNAQEYVARKSDRRSKRNWWLVKHLTGRGCGVVALGCITMPSRYVGKKVRFKVELVEEVREDG